MPRWDTIRPSQDVRRTLITVTSWRVSGWCWTWRCRLGPDGSVVCPTGAVGIRGRAGGAGPANIPARRQPLGPGASHGGDRGTKTWLPVQTQAERQCEEADRTNLPERGMGGGGATLAG